MYIIELYRLVNGTLERMEEIIDYTGLQFYNKLNGTGGLQFYLNTGARKAMLDNLYRYRTQVVVKNNNTIVWFGPLTKLYGRYQNVEGFLNFNARTYLDHLNARTVSSEYLQTDAGEIAWSAIDEVQNRDNGDLVITEGDIQSTVLRDRKYYYKSVSELIVELANVNNGFDFSLNATVDSSNRFTGVNFNVYQELGSVRNDLNTLQMGINVNNIEFATKDSIYNYITAIGSGFSEEENILSIAESTASQQGFTRREDVVKYADISIQETLDERAYEALLDGQSEQYDINIGLIPNKRPTDGEYILGDTLNIDLALPDSTLRFTGSGRVVEINTTVDDVGVGKITPKLQFYK